MESCIQIEQRAQVYLILLKESLLKFNRFYGNLSVLPDNPDIIIMIV